MNLKKGTETELNIESTAFKGKGVAKANGLAVFVPNTIPGDRVRVRITKSKKKYREAKLLEVLKPGAERIKPKCGHAKVCGGCSWQHAGYPHQLKYKQQQVQDHIERIGGFENFKVNPVISSDQIFYYRNKMEYSIGNRRWLTHEEIHQDEFVSDRCFAAGLHAPGRFDKILNLKECHLQQSPSFEILDFIRSYCVEHDIEPFDTIEHTGFMRNVVIRNSCSTGEVMVNIVTYRDDQKLMGSMKDQLLEKFPEITTIINNVNDTRSPTAVGRYEVVLHGPGYITDSIGDFAFKIDANTFFQTNTKQAEELCKVALKFADPQPGEVVHDLYCGVGTLSLFASKKADKVVGIELSEVAIQNARSNAEENGVGNVSFVKGDMSKVFRSSIAEQYGAPDCIITDPPRSGMHPDVVERLNELQVPKLVYVSCNSSTMARDLKELSRVYELLEVQPVDMFPQTYHIENVANLRARNRDNL